MAKEKSNLSQFFDVISKQGEERREQEETWRKEIGTPYQTMKNELDDYGYGFWKCEDRILVAQIGKRGPILSSVRFFSPEFITALYVTLKS